MTPITSSANSQFKTWKSLLSSKGIKKEGLFLLSGEKLIREFAREGSKLAVRAELVRTGFDSLTQAPAFELSADLFRELDELGTGHSLLVVETPEIPAWDPDSRARGLEVFCPLGDPQNVGAVLRSAEAFGVSKVVLLQEAANPFLPKAIKASGGSALRMQIEKGPALAELSGSFHALELEGRALPKHQWSENARLLIGEEGPGLAGVSAKARIDALSIPTQGVESLNAGVAASIAFFHYRGQFPS